ncbi:MAG: MutS-related protein [Gemmatirosa sp.]
MTSPGEHYARAIADASREVAERTTTSRGASSIRLLLAAAAVGLWMLGPRIPSRIAWMTTAALAAAFAAAVWWHRQVGARGEAAARRLAAARAGLARTETRWADLPPARTAMHLADGLDAWAGVLARDLDVCGDRSLERLVDVVHPALGGARLLAWLLGEPAPRPVIEDRQASVADLRARPDLLLATTSEARHGGPASARGLAAMRAWCDAPADEAGWLRPAAWLASVATLAIAGLLLAQLAITNALVGLAIVAQLLLAARARAHLKRRTGALDLALPELGGATRVMALLVAAHESRGRLAGVQQRLRAERAVPALGALVRLLTWNEARYSPMAHWALNATLGFDVHLAAAFARWRRHHGPQATAWLDDVADAEALLALGTLAFEHPAWSFPTLHDAPREGPLRAQRLAHPLLASAVAVPNDVMLGATGDVVVVSGPNMAGKTTFLRAVGLNVLLAQAGSVVAAEALHLRRARLRTSVRVEDDLARGVSLFLAEVTRLRDVIADAERPDAPPVLFLFDEILHGTNARDRRVATRVVLDRLRRAGAVGLVTTHDPAIADADGGAQPTPLQQLHFDGKVTRDANGGLALRFDYRARPGPATHANALAVLEMMGIGPDTAGSDEAGSMSAGSMTAGSDTADL